MERFNGILIEIFRQQSHHMYINKSTTTKETVAEQCNICRFTLVVRYPKHLQNVHNMSEHEREIIRFLNPLVKVLHDF